MKLLQVTILLLGLTGTVFAIDDTPENRTKMADQYLQVVPVQELLSDMTDKIAATVPAASRDIFVSAMKKHLDVNALVDVEKQALIKYFTADELNAMAQFYGSPTGKSVLKKFGSYMAELMPAIQAQVSKAVQESAQELQPAH
jgi:hypothetical protein